VGASHLVSSRREQSQRFMKATPTSRGKEIQRGRLRGAGDLRQLARG
jgi:hypothetical protein